MASFPVTVAVTVGAGDAAGGEVWRESGCQPVAQASACDLRRTGKPTSQSQADEYWRTASPRGGSADTSALVEASFRRLNELLTREVQGVSDQISIMTGQFRDDLLRDLHQRASEATAGSSGDSPGTPKARLAQPASACAAAQAASSPRLSPAARRTSPAEKSWASHDASGRRELAGGSKVAFTVASPTKTPSDADLTAEMVQRQLLAGRNDASMFQRGRTQPPARRPRKSTSSFNDEDYKAIRKCENMMSLPRARTSVSSQKRAVFADEREMKEQVRAAVLKKAYNVREMYKEEGWIAAIARSNAFEAVTLFVIFANSIWIAVDTDLNDSPTLYHADTLFQVVEHLFCSYFTLEWIIRFFAFKKKTSGLKDGWFVFDSLLVSVMILETWVMTMILASTSAAQEKGSAGHNPLGDTSILKLVRIVRLTRMARMVRLLRAFPELMILIKGIVVAARSVFFTLVLLVIIIYVFAVMFRQLAEDANPELESDLFPTVITAMKTLLLDGILPDQGAVITSCLDSGYMTGAAILLFILMGSLTVMNMLVGILCEVVSVVSQVEKEQLQVTYVRGKLLKLYTALGMDDGSGKSSMNQDQFRNFLMDPNCIRAIHEVGVDALGLVELGSYFFSSSEDGTISFSDMLDIVLQLRGSNTCTVKEIVDLRKYLFVEMSQLKDLIYEFAGVSKHADSTYSNDDTEPPPPPPLVSYPPLPCLPNTCDEDAHLMGKHQTSGRID